MDNSQGPYLVEYLLIFVLILIVVIAAYMILGPIISNSIGLLLFA